MSADSYVYFIRAEGTDLVKIGVTNDPARRLAMLQTGSPTKLTLWFVILGNREREVEIHEQFSGARKFGEWFQISPEINDAIDALRSKHSVKISLKSKRPPATAFEKALQDFGFTQSSAAARLNMSPSHFSNICTGTRPCGLKTARNLEKLTGRHWSFWFMESRGEAA